MIIMILLREQDIYVSQAEQHTSVRQKQKEQPMAFQKLIQQFHTPSVRRYFMTHWQFSLFCSWFTRIGSIEF